MTALEIINAVQRGMRLPEQDFASDHSKLILEHINTAQYLVASANDISWDELEKTHSATTEAGVLSYELPVEDSVMSVAKVKIGDKEITASSIRTGTVSLSLAGGKAKVVFNGVPIAGGAALTVVYHIHPPPLVAGEDVCVLPATLVKLGAIALAKTEQGVDSTLDKAIYAEALNATIYQRNKGKIW